MPSQLTNYERWSHIMKDVGSPQTYIDWSFYYMISVALQRRVWIGDEGSGVYPNVFIILVGGPGVGKGQVIGPVGEMLRSLKVIRNAKTSTPTPNEPREASVDESQLNTEHGKSKSIQEPYLFPVGADATTFEALTKMHSSATKCIVAKTLDAVSGKVLAKTIIHASLCFILEELASIIRKHQENTINYLQTAYDCKDYTYVTKHQGEDLIRKPSLCLLAGTTPDFMETSLNDMIINQGFAARCIFLYETTPRWHRYLKPRFDEPSQLVAKKEFQEHLRKLSTLYGECKLTKEADDYLRNWWEKDHPIRRKNSSLKLEHYYTRKKVHVWKLCMLLHYAELADMNTEIGIDIAKTALSMYDNIEDRMHYAISFDNKNPLYTLSKRIVAQLRRSGPMSRVELLMEFGNECNDAQLTETLSYLLTIEKIESLGNSRYEAKKKE